MKRILKGLTINLLVLALTVSCVSVVYSAESSEKAKQILEKTYKKYSDLLEKESKDIKSVAAKISVKGSGQLPMNESGGMPLDLDATIELYFEQPRNMYLSISGNLGNAKIIVSGKDKKTATVMFPNTKQFATMDVPEPEDMIKKTQKGDEEPGEFPEMEEFLEEVNLTYEGTEQTKTGKAHKINIKGKDPSEKGSVTVYIVDGKWDPARLDISAAEAGKVVVEFEKLELNVKIPDKQFVPDTEGYTQISEQELATVVMMQIMGAMMQQQGAEE